MNSELILNDKIRSALEIIPGAENSLAVCAKTKINKAIKDSIRVDYQCIWDVKDVLSKKEKKVFKNNTYVFAITDDFVLCPFLTIKQFYLLMEGQDEKVSISETFANYVRYFRTAISLMKFNDIEYKIITGTMDSLSKDYVIDDDEIEFMLDKDGIKGGTLKEDIIIKSPISNNQVIKKNERRGDLNLRTMCNISAGCVLVLAKWFEGNDMHISICYQIEENANANKTLSIFEKSKLLPFENRKISVKNIETFDVESEEILLNFIEKEKEKENEKYLN